MLKPDCVILVNTGSDVLNYIRSRKLPAKFTNSLGDEFDRIREHHERANERRERIFDQMRENSDRMSEDIMRAYQREEDQRNTQRIIDAINHSSRLPSSSSQSNEDDTVGGILILLGIGLIYGLYRASVYFMDNYASIFKVLNANWWIYLVPFLLGVLVWLAGDIKKHSSADSQKDKN